MTLRTGCSIGPTHHTEGLQLSRHILGEKNLRCTVLAGLAAPSASQQSSEKTLETLRDKQYSSGILQGRTETLEHPSYTSCP